MILEKIPMKSSRFSDAQIMSILKQTEDGIPMADLCREHGMRDASFYKGADIAKGLFLYFDPVFQRVQEVARWAVIETPFAFFQEEVKVAFWNAVISSDTKGH
jgi:Transposase